MLFFLQLEHLHWFKDIWRCLVWTKTCDPEKGEILILNQEQQVSLGTIPILGHLDFSPIKKNQ